MPAQEAAVAVTKKDKQAALAALTSAALSLPGLDAGAAIPSTSIKTNVSYGHYEESDNRMRVDIYHADAVIPLSDRLELAFSLDRDTYSGATPAYSLPEVMTNRLKNDEGILTRVDITSAASAGVSKKILTDYFLKQLLDYRDGIAYVDADTRDELQSNDFFNPLFDNDSTLLALSPSIASALNINLENQTSRLSIDDLVTFIRSYVQASGDYRTALSMAIQDEADRNRAISRVQQVVAEKLPPASEPTEIVGQTAAEQAYQAEIQRIDSEYDEKTAQLDAELALIKQSLIDKTNLIQQSFQTQLAAIQADYSQQQTLLNEDFYTERDRLRAALAALENDYSAKINQVQAELTLAESLFDSQKQAIENHYTQQKQLLDNSYHTQLGQLDFSSVETPPELLAPLDSEASTANADSGLTSVDLKRQLVSNYTAEKKLLNDQYTSDKTSLDQALHDDNAALESHYLDAKNALESNYAAQAASLIELFNQAKQSLQTEHGTTTTALESERSEKAAGLERQYNTDYTAAASQFDTAHHTLSAKLSEDLSRLDAQLAAEQLNLANALSSAQQALENAFTSTKSTLESELSAAQTALDERYLSELAKLNSDYEAQVNALTDTFNTAGKNLTDSFDLDTARVETDSSSKIVELTEKFNTDLLAIDGSLPALKAQYDADIQALTEQLAEDKSQLDSRFDLDKTALANDYDGKFNALSAEHDAGMDSLASDYASKKTAIKSRYDGELAVLLATKTSDADTLTAQKDTNLATLDATLSADQLALTSAYESQKTALKNSLSASENELAAQLDIDLAAISAQLAADIDDLQQRLNLDQAALDAELSITLADLTDKLNQDKNLATDQLASDKNLLNLGFDSDKTGLDNRLSSAESALVSEFNASILNQFKTATGFDTTHFETNKATLLERFTLATGFSDTDFTANQASLLSRFTEQTGFASVDLTANQTSLTNRYVADNTLLSNSYNADKNELTAAFDLNELTLTDAFNTNSGNLEIKLNTDTTNLNSVLAGAISNLDSKLSSDIFALDEAQVAAETSYLAGNPKPEIIETTANIRFDLDLMTQGAYYGHANTAPIAGGSCSGSGSNGCFYEDNFVIGTIEDPDNSGAHLHKAPGDSLVNPMSPSYSITYHNDSGGIYIRSQDSKTFSLDTMLFLAPNSVSNPGTGAEDYWEILGFNTALNPNLAGGGTSGTGTCDDYATCIAYETIANGFRGRLDLSTENEDFKQVNAVWIHYNDNPDTPARGGDVFQLEIDSIRISIPTFLVEDWESSFESFKTDYQATVYDPALADLNSTYSADKTKLESDNLAAITDLQDKYDSDLLTLSNGFDADKSALQLEYNNDLTSLTSTFNSQKTTLTDKYNADLAKLIAETDKYNTDLTTLSTATDKYASDLAVLTTETDKYQAGVANLATNPTFISAKNALDEQYAKDLEDLTKAYNDNVALLETENADKISALTTTFNSDKGKLETDNDLAKTELETAFQTQKELLDAQAASKQSQLSSDFAAEVTDLRSDSDSQIALLTDKFNGDSSVLLAAYDSNKSALNNEFNKQLNDLESTYLSQKSLLDDSYQTQFDSLDSSDKAARDALTADYASKLAALDDNNAEKLTALTQAYNLQLDGLNSAFNNEQDALTNSYKAALGDNEAVISALTEQFEIDKTAVENDKTTQLDGLSANYASQLAALSEGHHSTLANLFDEFEADKTALLTDKTGQETALQNAYQQTLNELNSTTASQRTALTVQYNRQLADLNSADQTQRTALTENFNQQIAELEADKQSRQSQAQNDYSTKLADLNQDIDLRQDALNSQFASQLADLNSGLASSQSNLSAQFNADSAKLDDEKASQSTALTDQYDTDLTALNAAQLAAQTTLTGLYRAQLSVLTLQNQQEIAELTARYKQQSDSLLADKDSQIADLIANKQQLQALNQQYQAEYATLSAENQQQLANLTALYQQQSQILATEKQEDEQALASANSEQLAAANAEAKQEVADLVESYLQQSQALLAQTSPPPSTQVSNQAAATSATTGETSVDEDIAAAKQQVATALSEVKTSQEQAASASKTDQVRIASAAAEEAQSQVGKYYDKETTIAIYRDMLNTMVPKGNRVLQRFQVQPQETRSMPQFTARYYWDNTTLAVNGGLSDEPDFLSNFGSVSLSHEFNDKLTTVNAGYGLTSNQITRGATHSNDVHSHCDEEEAGECPDYPNLNADSTFHNFNAGISQILGKNTLYQFSASYTNQHGYLSNPYKHVYIRGEVTAEEYYAMDTDPNFDWNDITKLEMVSTELFREVRPNNRNMWSFSNRLNQHIPALDASLHFDYRFYLDDWGINSHTFELKWYQSLPGGFTVTPGIRYYSQSQADFFAPYFLAPRADGHYSSDFRLSAFGDLSGGITVSKQFARGVKLEAGFEYVTHSGNLKLGGGGVGDYADFDYYIAHANLNIDLGARPFSLGASGDHHSHHHHHGAPIPAGVMFGHMMPKADDIMIGYRFMYGVQSGSMLHGETPVDNAYLVANACPGSDYGCLYRPMKMHMQMHMLDLMYAPTDWLNLMLMPQLMSMDMTMSQPLRPFATYEEDYDYAHHAGTRHSSNELGDTIATALVKLYDDGRHHLHAGIGISAPTGDIDAQLSPPQLNSTAGTALAPNSAVMQDYGMQLGSGTWDFKPSLTYTGHADAWGWGLQLSGTKRLEKNKYGYAYGDLFQATGWGSYAIFNWLNASVRGVYSWQDKIQGATWKNHDANSPFDFPSNYGGRFVDVGFGLNVRIPDGQFAGHSLGVEWLQPVMTDFNGSQLDRDGALSATWSFSF